MFAVKRIVGTNVLLTPRKGEAIKIILAEDTLALYTASKREISIREGAAEITLDRSLKKGTDFSYRESGQRSWEIEFAVEQKVQLGN